MSMTKNRYVLVVVGKEARSGAKGNPIVAYEGEQFIVVRDEDGWVQATTRRWDENVPRDAKTFMTKAAAEAFFKRWEPHPWWVKPTGELHFIEVQPKMETRQVGWEVVS